MLSTHRKTYFLVGKTLKNFISQEILGVWHGGMACSKEEVGKNLESEGNRDGIKKRLEAEGPFREQHISPGEDEKHGPGDTKNVPQCQAAGFPD